MNYFQNETLLSRPDNERHSEKNAAPEDAVALFRKRRAQCRSNMPTACSLDTRFNPYGNSSIASILRFSRPSKSILRWTDIIFLIAPGISSSRERITSCIGHNRYCTPLVWTEMLPVVSSCTAVASGVLVFGQITEAENRL